MKNKFADNEIMKALECCITNKCDECAIYKECHNENGKGRVQAVLDLINRQKAEIERLIGDVTAYKVRWAKAEASKETAKSEARKEFAERLKENASRGFWEEEAYFSTLEIDNLIKEMEGADE